MKPPFLQRQSVAPPLMLALSLVLMVSIGCGTPGSPSADAERGLPRDLRPDDAVQGRVVAVNPTLRYVVMDFAVRKLPALQQRLNVYRQGRKVGEVKVTGPVIDETVAGDIRAGEAQVGDQVRED